MFKRKIFFWFSAVLIAFCVIYLFIRIDIFTQSVKYILQSELSSIVGSPVKVYRASLLPPDKLILKGITLDGFYCEKIIVSINFKKITAGIRSVSKITVTNPVADISILSKINFSQKSPAGGNPPLIEIKNGCAFYNKWKFSRINLEMASTDGATVIKTEPITVTGKNISSFVKLSGILKNTGFYKLNGEITGFSINRSEPAKGIFKITGDDNSFSMLGNLTSSRASIVFISTAPAGISAISKSTAPITMQISGNIKSIKSFSAELYPGILTEYLPEAASSFTGYLYLPGPKVNLNLAIPSAILLRSISVNNTKISLKYSNEILSVDSASTVMSGSVSLAGSAGKKGLNLSFEGKGINLKSAHSNGILSFKTVISGTPEKPEIKNKINIGNFSLLNNNFKNVTGQFNWKNSNGRLKITGNNLLVNMTADRHKISEFKIKHKKSFLTLHGSYNDLIFTVANFDISLLNKKLAGLVEVSGKIKGLPDKLEFTSKFYSPNISLNGSSTPVSGNMSYKNGELLLTELKLSGISGWMGINTEKEETAGEINITKCDSNLITPFFNIAQQTLRGTIFGKINWKGDIKKPEIKGILAAKDGLIMDEIRYHLIVLSFETGAGKIIVNDFLLQQQPSINSVKMSGEIRNKKYAFDMKINGLDIAGKMLSGDLKIKGEDKNKLNIFHINSDLLSYGNISEKFSATGDYDGEKIHFKDIGWDKVLNGFLLYYPATKYLSSVINFSLKDASQLIDNLNGNVEGKGILRGATEDLSLSVVYQLKDCRLYNLPVYGKGEILSKAGLVKILESQFVLDGSNVAVSGLINMKDREFECVNIAASGLKMGTVNYLTRKALPLKGTMNNVDVSISGPFSAPEFLVNFTGTELLSNNNKIDNINGKVALKGSKISFSKCSAKWSDTEIKILPDSYVDFTKEKKFKLITEVRNLKFQGVVLFGEAVAEGKSIKKNLFRAEVYTTGLWLNQLHLKKLRQQIEYSSSGILKFLPNPQESISMSGSFNFSKPEELIISSFTITEKGNKRFNITGRMKDSEIYIAARGENIHLGNLLNFLNLKVTASGNTNFNIRVSGKQKEPTITCMINSNNGMLENISFDAASVLFQIKQNILKLKHIKISQKNIYSAEGGGTMPLPLTKEAKTKLSNYPINISFSATNGNLSVLKSLTKAVKKATGRFSTSITVRGTLNAPDISGRFTANADELYFSDIFNKLSNVKCAIDFIGNKINIAEFSGFVDKEPINLSGAVFLRRGFGISSFDFALNTPKDNAGIPVVINELPIKSAGMGQILPIMSDITTIQNPSKARIKANARVYGTPNSYKIDGDLVISKANFTYPGGGGEESSESHWDFLKNAEWNLLIKTGKDCWYERDFVSVEAKGELLLHSKGSSPLVTGKVEAIRGEIEYLGKTFSIKEAVFEAQDSNLFLSGIAEMEAEIEKRREDMATKQMVTEYLPETIILTIDRGPLEAVKPRFSSLTNPQMDEKLATQAAIGLADTKQKQPFSTDEMSQTVNTVLTTPFVKSLLKRTGLVDNFSIKKEATTQTTQAGDTNHQSTIQDLYKGTRMQIGKSFTRGLAVSYGVKLDELENKLSLKHDIELSYQLRNGLLLRTSQELGRDQYGDRASKFFLEKYWRFGQ